MEFLYRLYSNNYFGIGLFIVITILAFLFLIILFFGKKDEKKRSIEEQMTEQNNNISNEFDNNSLKEKIETSAVENNEFEPIEIKEEIPIEPVFKEPTFEIEEPTIKLDSFAETKEEFEDYATSNYVLNSDLVSIDEPEEYEIKKEDNSKVSDIYNLNSLMNEDYNEIENIPIEEESIDDVLNKYDAIEEKIIDKQQPIDSYDIHEVEPITVNEPEENFFERPIEQARKSSTPFSSVYLSKEESPIVKEEVINDPIKEEPVVTPSRPTFDLPKRMELPKRNNNAINENIISSISRENNRDKDNY